MRSEWTEKIVERCDYDIFEPGHHRTRQNTPVWQMETMRCILFSDGTIHRQPKFLAFFNVYGKLLEYYRYHVEEVGDAENGPCIQEDFVEVSPAQWTRKIRRLRLPKARR